MKRTLVAGVGNPLRGDDGFGPAVIRALEEEGPLPPGVTAVDVGIGGMGLIHELMTGYDELVVVDAVHRAETPGRVVVLEPTIPQPAGEGGGSSRAVTADMHELVPERVFALARALDVLPARVRILGCQATRTEELVLELSPPVSAAVPKAVDTILRLVAPDDGAEALDGR